MFVLVFEKQRNILFVGTKRSRSILYPISNNTQWWWGFTFFYMRVYISEGRQRILIQQQRILFSSNLRFVVLVLDTTSLRVFLGLITKIELYIIII